MLHREDTLFFWLFLLLLSVLAVRPAFRRLGGRMPSQALWPDDGVVRLLNRHGYAVLCRKMRIPIRIESEGGNYETRCFIDGIAQKDGKRYVVKESRRHKRLELTGASIREHLMPFYLLGNWEGVLYVDVEKGELHLFRFEIDTSSLPQRRSFAVPLLAFLAGVLTAMLFFN